MRETRFNIWKSLSTLISIVLHPLSFPSILFIIIYLYIPSLLAPWTDEGKLLIIGMIFFGTYILPVLLTFFYFYSTNDFFAFNDLLMSNRRERIRPFLIVSFIYTFLGYFLQQELKANYVVVGIVFIMAFTILASAIISAFWKISIHAVAISGFIGFVMVLNEKFADGELFYHFLGAIVLSGFLLSARLYLHEHNFLQVLGGWFMGLAFTLAGMLYYIY